MSALPVVNPADFLPAPTAIETVDFETLFAAFQTKFAALWPDYNVEESELDPGAVIGQANAELRVIDRARVNDVYRALRLSLAKLSNLDGLAADRGVVRLTYVPATLTTAAVMEDDDSLLLRTWLAMQTWGSGSRFGVEYYARTLGMQNLADCNVVDFPGEGRMTCVVLPIPGLSPDDAESMRASIGNGLMARHRRPGSVWIDTVLADIVTVPYTGVLKIRRGASQSALLAAAQSGLATYMATRRRIGALVPVSAMEAAQFGYGVVEAQASQPFIDIVPTGLQAVELGTVTITLQVVDD